MAEEEWRRKNGGGIIQNLGVPARVREASGGASVSLTKRTLAKGTLAKRTLAQGILAMGILAEGILTEEIFGEAVFEEGIEEVVQSVSIY